MDLPPETVEVWASNLRAYPEQAVKKAMRRIVERSKWFPSWAEFLEVLLLGDHSDPETAWGIARACKGIVGDEGDQLIREAVQAIGGDWYFAHAENLGTLRIDFTATYRALLERQRIARSTELLELANPTRQEQIEA